MGITLINSLLNCFVETEHSNKVACLSLTTVEMDEGRFILEIITTEHHSLFPPLRFCSSSVTKRVVRHPLYMLYQEPNLSTMNNSIKELTRSTSFNDPETKRSFFLVFFRLRSFSTLAIDSDYN